MRYWIYLFLLLIGAACTVQKRVCPTYQSAFIFDKNTKENHFSYYNNNFKAAMTVTASVGKSIEIPQKDSLWVLQSLGLDGPAVPFHRKVRRDKHLLLPKKSHRKALKLMRTVERKFVKEAYDSAKMAEIHRLDSLSLLDSTYRISVAREKFNLDQDIYMWYFKDQLLLPDVRWEKYDKKTEEERLAKEAIKNSKKNKKGWFSFLRRKKKQRTDTVYVRTELPPDATIDQKTKAIEKEDYNEEEKYNIEDELIDSTAVNQYETDTVNNAVGGKVKEQPADNSKSSAKELKKKEKEAAKQKAGEKKAAEKKAKEDEKKARSKAKEEAQQGVEIDESLLREKAPKPENEEGDPQEENK